MTLLDCSKPVETAGKKRPVILYLLTRYPQASQTYIKTEIEALKNDYDIRIITCLPAESPYENHLPFIEARKREQMQAVIDEIKPQLIHTHFTHMTRYVGPLAKKNGIPFTVRSHSFDVLQRPIPPLRERLTQYWERRSFDKELEWLNHHLCLGVLSFPFLKPYLRKMGVKSRKITSCYPIIDYAKFHNRQSNGAGVLNMGAILPKKKMEDFVDLAARTPQYPFNLYAIASSDPAYYMQLQEYNQQAGNPVNIVDAIDPDRMPQVYQQHQWLVYTACPKTATVGWPMAIAEAQAAGLGVCLPNLRPDLKQYLGGAGFLYDSIDQVQRIISRPYPDKMRERGFQQAQKSDIHTHKHRLTRLWEQALNG